MTNAQLEFLNKLSLLQKKLTQEQIEYWKGYSYVDTWQFWIVLLMLVIPLIILYLTIDRKKIFLLGFYGFNMHIWFGYADSISISLDWVDYPFHTIPFLPSFSLEASLIPVAFMLVYQWTLNHNKNYYLYTLITAALFAFVLKPILVSVDLFRLNQNMHYYNLFIVYIIVFLVSKAITSFFVFLQRSAKQRSN